jgi:hypothetical protein
MGDTCTPLQPFWLELHDAYTLVLEVSGLSKTYPLQCPRPSEYFPAPPPPVLIRITTLEGSDDKINIIVRNDRATQQLVK